MVEHVVYMIQERKPKMIYFKPCPKCGNPTSLEQIKDNLTKEIKHFNVCMNCGIWTRTQEHCPTCGSLHYQTLPNRGRHCVLCRSWWDGENGVQFGECAAKILFKT